MTHPTRPSQPARRPTKRGVCHGRNVAISVLIVVFVLAMGIPVTHRDCSRGVTLVTGHARNGAQAGEGPDWKALARTGTTLVIYMGMKHLADIARELQSGGLAPTTPVAVIQNGTLANEQRLISSLALVASDAAACGIGSPAIVVVGDVVRYSRQTMITMPLLKSA